MTSKRVHALAILSLALAACVPCASAQTEIERAHVLDLLHAGRDAMQQGDLPGAERRFQAAVQAAPDLSDAYLGLGLVQVRRGEMADAVQSLTSASELNQQLRGAHLFLGIAQYQSGLSESAAASLRAELALDPVNVEALTWLGIVELGANHPELATGPLDQAAALAPKDPHVLYYCGRAHMLVSGKFYRSLAELNPDSALVHRGLAESYDVVGQPEKAIAEYEAAIKREPGNPDLYEALGDADQKMGRVDAAREAYQEELKLNAHSAVAMYNLGRIDVERGKPESGVAILRQAEAAHASPAPTDFYLGLGLAELGENGEAAKWLEASLENHPSPFIEQGAWYQLARVYPKLNRKVEAQHALDQLKLLLAQAQRQKDATAREAEARSLPADNSDPPSNQP